MHIEANFECGNVIVEQMSEREAHLAIRPDSNAKYFQWFHFRVTGESGILRTFHLTNASAASYPHAWNGYRALASYDGEQWFRVQTTYLSGQLHIIHRAEQNSTRYAFFVPYLAHQQERLFADCAAAGQRRAIVTTADGNAVDMMVFGKPDAQRKAWVISRQHAGEPMAEYCIDGLMRRLADPSDRLAQRLLAADIAFYCVPNVNPDGSARGNLRANAAGIDLNRDWKQNSPPQSVEVAGLLKAMEAEGVDFFLDLHGDEASQYVWLVQPHSDLVTPANSAAQAVMETFFQTRYAEYGPDPASVSPVNGVEFKPSPPDSGMAVDYVAWRFECPSLIVELPFKDTLGANGQADSLQADGCVAFGRDCLEMIAAVFDGLKD